MRAEGNANTAHQDGYQTAKIINMVQCDSDEAFYCWSKLAIADGICPLIRMVWRYVSMLFRRIMYSWKPQPPAPPPAVVVDLLSFGDTRVHQIFNFQPLFNPEEFSYELTEDSSDDEYFDALEEL
ncbi:unnamed protein product [Allacma fusca]|uniref:Uncharacterized protein n=1 Tax=Allacma fusca TaxID=39272 RepID=A0A8J2JXD9_9HEXA|nr:unnamed protein product [Allacma fusca]